MGIKKISPICQQLQIAYQALKSKNQEFDLTFEKARSTGNPDDLKQARKLMEELKEKRNTLQEMLWPFKELEKAKLEEQYEFQKKTFEDLGILERLSTGETGIKAINGKEYAFPTFHDVLAMARKNKEALKTKTEQGFNQLLIVPFGMKLDDLIKKYKQVILKHHQEGKLFATKENPSEPDEPLELDESEPVWVWDKYQNADETGELVYYPQEFSDNHQGKTKQDILSAQGGSASGGEAEGKTPGAGFNIILIEDLPNIPRGNPKSKRRRTQIDTQGSSIKKYIASGQTIPSPNEYLQAVNTEPIYNREIGMTSEDQLIYAILYLTKHNQVLDDYQGKGSVSYQIGAYFAASGVVPGAYWSRGDRQANLSGGIPGDRFVSFGVRLAVRVS